MYLPRCGYTLLQRVNLVILVLLEQLDLRLVLQPEQERRPNRIGFNLPRTLQQLITQRVLIHIKRKIPPLHSQRLQRMQHVVLHRLRTKLTIQLSLEPPPIHKSLTVYRRTPRLPSTKASVAKMIAT